MNQDTYNLRLRLEDRGDGQAQSEYDLKIDTARNYLTVKDVVSHACACADSELFLPFTVCKICPAGNVAFVSVNAGDPVTVEAITGSADDV